MIANSSVVFLTAFRFDVSTANKRLNLTWIPQPFLSEERERTLGMRLDESTVDFHKCGRLV